MSTKEMGRASRAPLHAWLGERFGITEGDPMMRRLLA